MSLKKDLLIIVNPISGDHSAPALCHKIYQSLDKNLFNITISFTGAKGEGYELARKAMKEAIPYVVAVGGDGTVNEVASALVHTPTALGIIPNGSGNGLARHLKIPAHVVQATQVINQQRVKAIDYCMANDTKFFCTFGMGFDALVSYAFSKSASRGFITYVEKVVQEYINYKPEEYIIECNGEKITSRSFLITCANASQWGNSAFIAPHASVTDGLIDVMTMEPFNLLDAGPLAFQLFTKRIDKRHNVKMYRAKEFTFFRPGGGIYHYDGEPIEMGEKVVVRNIQSGLNMLIPAE